MKPIDYKDFTIKAIVDNSTKIEAILKQSHARFLGIDDQRDTYFSTSKGKLKLRQGTIENLITHYQRIEENGMERTIVYQYDINPGTDQIDALFQNHSVIGVVQKTRKIYFIDTIKIHLDTTTESKTFVEIEAIDRTGKLSDEVLRFRCLQMMERLKLSTNDLVKTGYLKEG